MTIPANACAEPSKIEDWAPIKGFDGCYEVSSLGKVRSLTRVCAYGKTRRGRTLALRPDKKGYQIVTLSINGDHTTAKVHRLVAQAFIANPSNKPEVNHKDLIKSNNTSSNLEWSTRKENQAHASAAGVFNADTNKKRGRILKPGDAEQIKAQYQSGAPIVELAKKYGVNAAYMRCIGHRDGWFIRTIASTSTEAQRAKIAQLKYSGLTNREISVSVGINYNTVYGALRILKKKELA